MFNAETVWESIKRHWIVIALATVLCFAIGFGVSLLGSKSSSAPTEQRYTAETVLYVENAGYRQDTSIASMYSFYPSEYMLVRDVRRSVLGDEVAGAIRRNHGEEVEVTSPNWINEKNNEDYETHYVFIDVTTSSAQDSLAYAEEAANLTIENARETMPIENISLAEDPYLKDGGNEKAVDWGVDDFVKEDKTAIEVVSSGVSKKTLVIYAFAGLFLSAFGFAAYDILSRRVRSEKDVERMTSLSVLSVLSPSDSCVRLSNAVAALLRQNALKTVVVAGATEQDGAARVAEAMSAQLGCPVRSTNLVSDEDAQVVLASADSVLFVLKEAASSGSQIDESLKQLNISGAPVLGAAFVTKK